jgi:glucoamylase
MPLAWAHAEHVKLLRSLKDGGVFDMPPQTARRYTDGKHEVHVQSWRMNAKIKNVVEGRRLRLELLEPATVRWSLDNWRAVNDVTTMATGFGTHICDLPTQNLRANEVVKFTMFWSDRKTWEGANFEVHVG